MSVCKKWDTSVGLAFPLLIFRAYLLYDLDIVASQDEIRLDFRYMQQSPPKRHMQIARPSDAPVFFWLHIKKCGGGSVRRALAPDYTLAPRGARPVNFIQSTPDLWNDILNNFRVPLGDYQFRRALFAQRFLYPDSWNTFPRFAFVRPPVDRAVSAFFYLRMSHGPERSFVQHLEENGQAVPKDDHALFDVFLDLVRQAQASETIYQPVNLHFTTHVAPIWADVTGENGEVLLSTLYRLENMTQILQDIRTARGLPPLNPDQARPVNIRGAGLKFEPSPTQTQDIEAIYPHDMDLYENALPTFAPEMFQ